MIPAGTVLPDTRLRLKIGIRVGVWERPKMLRRERFLVYLCAKSGVGINGLGPERVLAIDDFLAKVASLWHMAVCRRGARCQRAFARLHVEWNQTGVQDAAASA